MEPIALNHYLYTDSNTTRYTDPSGHFFGGFASVVMNIVSTIGSAYPRIAGTVERGTVAFLHARAVALGIRMRNDALHSIYISIEAGEMPQQTIQHAYDKYYYATKYMSIVTGTALDTYSATGWMQAALGFAKGLTKIPLPQYSSVPSAYLARTNGLNHKVIAKLDNVVRDTIKFEEAMDILKDMTSLIIRMTRTIF